MTRRALFIGRWQPFHMGHDAIIREALNAGKSVAIAVRDTPLSESDPFTVNERLEMIQSHFEDEDVDVFYVPDIESVNVGRGVGYEVNLCEAPEDVKAISATEIRRKIREGDSSWEGDVPPAVAVSVKRFQSVRKLHAGCVFWFTGLPCSGKTTLALALRSRLSSSGLSLTRKLKLLDGDHLRRGLCSDLGFSREDRVENLRRASHVAATLANTRLIVLAAFITPYEVARRQVRSVVGSERFFEIYVRCSVEVCKRRDVKGMYAKALAGEITGFTGVDAPYEPPEEPWCEIRTDELSVGQSVNLILQRLGI